MIELPLKQIKGFPKRVEYQKRMKHYEQMKQNGTDKRLLKEFEKKMNVENFDDYQYLVELYFGSQKQLMTLLFDTGSSWTWVPIQDKKCLGVECEESKFQQQLSKTYQDKGVAQSVTYGQGQISGKIVNDNILFDKTKSQKDSVNMNFLAVDKTKDLNSLKAHGILGLSPKLRKEGDEAAVDLIIKNMKDQNKISRALFSIELNNQESKKASYLYLGGWKNELIEKAGTKRKPDDKDDKDNKRKSDDGIFWMNINSNLHWGANLYDAKFGNTDEAIDYSVGEVIFDSGSSLTYLPPQEYDIILKKVRWGKKCEESLLHASLQICTCKKDKYKTDKSFPDIKFQIGSLWNKHWVTMLPEHYIKYDEDEVGCKLLIAKETDSDSNMWLLGDSFLRNYYTVYDLDNLRMGVVGDVETTTSGFLSTWTNNELYALYAGFFSSIAILLCGAALIYRSIKMRREAKLNEDVYNEDGQKEEKRLDIYVQDVCEGSHVENKKKEVLQSSLQEQSEVELQEEDFQNNGKIIINKN